MKITSSAFENNQSIPPQYTCDGENISPPLEISGVPKNAQELALIIDDPDSPTGNWNHLVLWNIDPKTTIIKEGSLPKGAVCGINDFGDSCYGGPCPSEGRHHYIFKLFALKEKAKNLKNTFTKEEVEREIKDLIIASAELTGVYERK